MPIDCIKTCYYDCFIKILEEDEQIIRVETRSGNIAELHKNRVCHMGRKDSEGYIRIRIDRADAKINGLV
jgi:hypothetical protein